MGVLTVEPDEAMKTLLAQNGVRPATAHLVSALTFRVTAVQTVVLTTDGSAPVASRTRPWTLSATGAARGVSEAGAIWTGPGPVDWELLCRSSVTHGGGLGARVDPLRPSSEPTAGPRDPWVDSSSLEDGAARWQAQLTGHLGGSPVVRVAEERRRTAVLDVLSGNLRWFSRSRVEHTVGVSRSDGDWYWTAPLGHVDAAAELPRSLIEELELASTTAFTRVPGARATGSEATEEVSLTPSAFAAYCSLAVAERLGPGHGGTVEPCDDADLDLFGGADPAGSFRPHEPTGGIERAVHLAPRPTDRSSPPALLVASIRRPPGTQMRASGRLEILGVAYRGGLALPDLVSWHGTPSELVGRLRGRGDRMGVTVPNGHVTADVPELISVTESVDSATLWEGEAW